MIRYVEYSDCWPSPNRVASIRRSGKKRWHVVLTDYRQKRVEIKERECVCETLTSAQGKARTFIARGSRS